MYERVLPVGTVVMLKDAYKRMMIMGYQQSQTEDLKKVYDYIGCIYPEGFIKVQEMRLFDHEDIEIVFEMGFQNEEQEMFRKDLENELKRK